MTRADEIIIGVESAGWRVVRGASAESETARYVFWFRAIREGQADRMGRGDSTDAAAIELSRAIGAEPPNA
jgi:hypothetical protein